MLVIHIKLTRSPPMQILSNEKADIMVKLRNLLRKQPLSTYKKLLEFLETEINKQDEGIDN